MTLVPGARLGPYEIISTLGVGGMGEVYKARDVRLNRAVAIKVLPTDKLTDPERKRRFVQEARAASALNHPNIVTIYDVGSENGVEFLAMEFVDGKTLEDLTPRDGFRLPELLRYAVQIADALAKAHAAGIVHRDLKPGNAMVTGDGLVKVLDFGLAKLAPATGDEGATHMGGGTATAAPGSEAGLIVGTASFMSPEQAEGRPVDARSDVFSFGAMLYEMATGQRAFRGETAMSTISAILRDEPTPLSTLRADIPPEVDRVIRRCLRKDPNRRFQTFADLKVALLELKEESDSGTLMRAPRHSTPASGVAPRMVAIALGSAVIAAAAVIGWIALRPAEAPPPPMQRPVPLTTYRGDETDPSFSPDGSQLVFSWDGDRQDNYDLYVKVVGPSAPLRLTTSPDRDFSPRWSPDGRTIAFVRQTADANEVRVIPALGGSERVLVRFARGRIVRMLDWSLDGKWLVAGGRLPNERIVRLHAVSIESGEARPLTDPPPETDGDVEPAVAPDGKSIAFARATGMNLSEIRVLNVSPAFEAQGTPRLLETVGTYTREPAWTADGRSILYTAGIDLRSNFYRMRLDGSSPPLLLEALGDAVEQPTLSRAGQRLAFSRPLRRTGIWRLDLHEPVRAPEPLIVSTFRDAFPQYSPDGSRIAFYSNRSGLNQIWAADADGGGAAQLTSMTGNITGSPRWSPDGKQISFDSNTGGDWQIYVMNADGGRPTALTKDRLNNFVTSWSRDGQWIYFSRGNAPETIWKVKPNGESPTDLGHAGSAVVESPDGKTLYFTKSLGGNRTSLWRMPLSGGDEVQVVAEMYRYNFVVTAKGIYYDTPSTPDKPSSIEFLDVATGKVTTIHTLNRPVDLGFAVSPDGRYLLFAQSDQSGGDLLLVEQFN